MKNLIYYVIGCDKDYSKLLEYSLHTLNACGNLNDVMVMCDEEYVPFIQHLPITYFHITKKNNTAMQSSMRKIEIFEFKHIYKYDKVLYLDCDIIIRNNIQLLFDTITRDDVLYVVRNCNSISNYIHSNYFSCINDPYEEKLLQIFDEKKVYGFNAGQFGFCVSTKMKDHFNKVYQSMQIFDPTIHFYEQSFMNNYFNRIFAIDYSLEDYVYLNGVTHNKPKIEIIHHLCGGNISYLDKLYILKNVFTSKK